jgi:hypothetical protein
MPSVLWRNLETAGMERCTLDRSPEGWRLAGTTLLAADGHPREVRWTVLTDKQWRTVTVGAHDQTPESNRGLALKADGEGNWESGGEALTGLDGAIDVDLSWSPATNTLPIRRHQLAVGEHAETTVAWIAFPGRDIRRVTQRYERIAPTTYRFTSGEFAADLEVAGNGLVVEYPGYWVAEQVTDD